MVQVYKSEHAYKIRVDNTIVTVTYAEWLIIKKQMTELLASEIFS